MIKILFERTAKINPREYVKAFARMQLEWQNEEGFVPIELAVSEKFSVTDPWFDLGNGRDLTDSEAVVKYSEETLQKFTEDVISLNWGLAADVLMPDKKHAYITENGGEYELVYSGEHYPAESLPQAEKLLKNLAVKLE